jgi:hypothetical protein
MFLTNVTKKDEWKTSWWQVEGKKNLNKVTMPFDDTDL